MAKLSLEKFFVYTRAVDAGKCDENMINDHDDFRLRPGVSEEKEKCVAS